MREAPARTRLSRATVRRAIRLGKLRATRPYGVRRLVVSADALAEFLRPNPIITREGAKASDARRCGP